MAAGIVMMALPDVCYQTFALPGGITITPMLAGEATDASRALLSCFGACVMLMGLLLFIVRWNTVNARPCSAGFLTVAAMCFKNATYDISSLSFNPFLCLCCLEVVSALHLILNPNEKWTSVSLKAHEDMKAAKKAAKYK